MLTRLLIAESSALVRGFFALTAINSNKPQMTKIYSMNAANAVPKTLQIIRLVIPVVN